MSEQPEKVSKQPEIVSEQPEIVNEQREKVSKERERMRALQEKVCKYCNSHFLYAFFLIFHHIGKTGRLRIAKSVDSNRV